ncbi:hypothetical protein NM688_g8883 [Phlebia brevispora]|uniref:Uncharacterized protein n=1 Tax=Phlebia brevispora TaxID=194682 RepID=A0ACC1RNS1_9APHY|nr:hypothetical protein NM688_g8883 [Phlebia brevispora]
MSPVVAPLYAGEDGFFKGVHRRASSSRRAARDPSQVPQARFSVAVSSPARQPPFSTRSPSIPMSISDGDRRSARLSEAPAMPQAYNTADNNARLPLRPVYTEEETLSEQPLSASVPVVRSVPESTAQAESPVPMVLATPEPEDIPLDQFSSPPTPSTQRDVSLEVPRSSYAPSVRAASVSKRGNRTSDHDLGRAIQDAKFKNAEAAGNVIDLTFSDSEDDYHDISAHPSDEEAAQASSIALRELLQLCDDVESGSAHDGEGMLVDSSVDITSQPTPPVPVAAAQGGPVHHQIHDSAAPHFQSTASEQTDEDEDRQLVEDMLDDSSLPPATTPSSHDMTPELGMTSDEASSSRSVRPRRNPMRAARSASSSTSSTSLPELHEPLITQPRIVPPRSRSGITEHLVPAMDDIHIEDDDIQILTWDKDGRPLAKEFADFHELAKDIPHDLQDHVNEMKEFARHSGRLPMIFESMMSENTTNDEPGAPDIRVINYIDNEETPPFEFHYSNLMWHGDNVPKPDLTNLKGCGCRGQTCSSDSPDCLCIKRQQEYLRQNHLDNLPGFAYDVHGRLKAPLHSYPLFECNMFCGCGEECQNRVVQRGRKIRVNIQKTPHKGWGIFAADRIPANTFVGIYAGEYLTDAEGNERGKKYNQVGRTYLFDIDFWYLKKDDPDKPVKYCVDAFHAGNFTRYLNHSCDPNCQLSPCYINEANIEKPLLAIFTRRDVAAGEELCFSYWGPPDDNEPEEEDDDVGHAGIRAWTILINMYTHTVILGRGSQCADIYNLQMWSKEL